VLAELFDDKTPEINTYLTSIFENGEFVESAAVSVLGRVRQERARTVKLPVELDDCPGGGE